MKKNSLFPSLLGLLLAVGAPCASRAAVDFRLPVGLSYAFGFLDVETRMEDVTSRTDAMPIPLAFRPYVEFESGFGIGVSAGPALVLSSQDFVWNGNWSGYKDTDSYIVPVSLDLRYTFYKKEAFSAYLRAGVSYPIAGGDYLDTAQPGFAGALGVEFLRDNKVSMGLEVGYDSSRLEIVSDCGRSRWVNPTGFTVGLFVIF